MKNDMIDFRRKSKAVAIGKIKIGGGAPISVQSMTKTKTEDVLATISEIHRLETAGCEIVRCAVPNAKAALCLKEIVPEINIPLVADIHFNYKLALMSLEAGVHKIRINPGNIRKRSRIEAVLKACLERNIPIRIGVNSGSIEPEILSKYRYPTAQALVESATHHIKICEAFNFENIIISVKSSDVTMMMTSYRILARQFDYPLHLGVTEAGPVWSGTIKSAVGIGTLLAEGIGDTIRVSLTGDPVEEIRVGKELLKVLGLRQNGITLISCPTCGRLDTPALFSIAQDLEKRLQNIKKPVTIALMGCAVNGPGEAKEADLGIACGKNEALFFKKGKIVGKIPPNEIVDKIVQEVHLFKT